MPAAIIATGGNMLGLLLESRAKRQRRAGGASLSVAIHTAIIGAIITGTATGKPAPKHLDPVVHLVVAPAGRTPTPVSHQTSSASLAQSLRTIAAPIIVVPPTDIPVGIPEIDLTRGTAPDSITIAGAPKSGSGTGIARSLDLGTNDGPMDVRELLMRIVASRKPKYPESLRQAGIDGHVLVRFVVDTNGAVDMSSVKFLESTHDLFTRSVRDVLPSFRFKPAEVGGKRVTSLADMPFEFSISK
ncbi:MAG: TonB family protein [Gemmatimonadaceae bacterium]